MTKLFYLVRVYANGEAKYSVRDEAGKSSWLEYNRAARPGNALFVDGALPSPKDNGYLSAAEVEQVQKVLLNELTTQQIDFGRPDVIGDQVDVWGSGNVDRYHGYRPEPYRKPFKWEH